jgi:DnaJ like chaperone protein
MKYLLPLLGLSYVLSPYDFFPDFFVGLGWFDDLAVLGLLWWYFFVYRKRRRYEYGARPGGTEQRAEGQQGGPASKGPDSKPRDPFTVLGVKRNASGREIKEAYRRLAGQYHPDKVMHLGEEFREMAERRFREIQSAYEEIKPD